MKWRMLICCILLLSACKSVRTVYDENGSVVDPDAPGGEKDFSSYMEEKFNSSFSEKKNEQGVPQSVSDKVSRYQSALDDSQRLDKEYKTSSFAGGSDSEMGSMSFAGAGKSFTAEKAYPGGMGKKIEKDLHPDFAAPSRGIYATEDSFARDRARSASEGEESVLHGRTYDTRESYYSQDMTSGYIETRRHNTPPPRVITKGEYYRKTIEETRSLLGRDEEKD